MTQKLIRKKLLKETALASIVLGALGGVTLLLSIMHADSEQNNQMLDAQTKAVIEEIRLLREKYSKVQNNADLYYEVVRKNANDGLSLNRIAFRDKQLKKFKSQYYLNDLRFTIGPVRELTDPKYKRTTSVVIASDISMEFNTLTDEDVYTMMNALSEELAGGVRFNKFNIKRKNKLTDTGLIEITKTGHSPLVEGKIEFTWFGISNLDTDKNGSDDSER